MDHLDGLLFDTVIDTIEGQKGDVLLSAQNIFTTPLYLEFEEYYQRKIKGTPIIHGNTKLFDANKPLYEQFVGLFADAQFDNIDSMGSREVLHDGWIGLTSYTIQSAIDECEMELENIPTESEELEDDDKLKVDQLRELKTQLTGLIDPT